MIGKAVKSILTADADVAAVISGRIAPVKASEKWSRPYVVYHVINVEHGQTKTGLTGLAQSRVQVNAVADSYDSARGLAEKVRLALQGYAGTAAGIAVHAVLMEGDGVESEFPQDNSDEARHRIAQDYVIWHSEPT